MKKNNKIALIVISIIVAFVLALILFLALLRVSAIKDAASDYEALNAQQELLKQDFSNVYTFPNYTIAPNEDGIEVTLTADEITGSNRTNKLIVSFDEDFNYVSSAYEESSINDTGKFIKLVSILVILCIAFSVVVLKVKKHFI